MTKIGKGNPSPEPPSFEHQLDMHAIKFLKALDEYESSWDEEKKSHSKGVMDESLALIRSAAQEINRSGIAKQEKLVQSDYALYIKNGTSENFSRLCEDIATLREYIR